MTRPRTQPDDHFRFSTFRKGDSTYVYSYRNEWDPEKKQSRIAKRIYAGTLNEITGRVKLGKKYLSNHPEYEGKTLYFENRTLVERSEQDVVAEVEQRETSWASNNLSYAACHLGPLAVRIQEPNSAKLTGGLWKTTRNQPPGFSYLSAFRRGRDERL